MANCSLRPSRVGGVDTAGKSSAHRGAALIVAVFVLLGIALLSLSVSGQQVLAHYQQISLDERRLHRQLASEQLFDGVAQTIAMNSRWQMVADVGYRAHYFAQGGPGQRVLYTHVDVAECPHEFETLSLCWRLQVRQAGSGFVRERMLVIPDESCAAPYWFAPEGRVLAETPFPPADAPPDSSKPTPVGDL